MFTTRLLLVSKKTSLKSFKNIKKLNLSQDYSSNSSTNNNGDPESNFSTFNVKKSLKLALLEFQEGPTNLKISSCPVCMRFSHEITTSKKSSSIYINKTTGNFICPSCQFTGKYGIIEKFLTASKSQKIQNELKTYHNIFMNAKQTHQRDHKFDPEQYERDSVPLTLENVYIVFDHFQIHEKIQKNSLISLRCRFNESKKELLVPLVDVENEIVGYKIISVNNTGDTLEYNERTVPENNCSGLAIVHPKNKVNPAKAILVLNIFDLLALSQTKIVSTFICLPHGLKSLPQECLPSLECYQELILWFNYDTAGWDVARNFAKKLDEKRCMFVRPTTAHPTPYKALINNQDIKGIFNASQPILHKAITTFSSLRQDVLSDLQNIDKVQGVKWKRYPLLNKYLKGHRKGELTILTGPTGSGKTTFMSDYSLDLAIQGVNTLWGSFEIRNTRLATTLLRQFAGKPLLDTNRAEDLAEFDHWANLFEQLPIYFMTFHGEQPIKVVMEAIDHAQYVNDINHVIIDNVQFMMGIAEEPKHIDRFWKQDVIIAAFRSFATRKNCHVTLVIHPRKEKDTDDLTTSSIFGGAKATQEADNVLIIQDKRLTSVRGKKFLQIAKNRYSGDLGIMPLEFDKLSLSYAQKAKKKPQSEETSNVSEPTQQIENPKE